MMTKTVSRPVYRAIEVVGSRQLARFCAVPGLSPLEPTTIGREGADAHWMLAAPDGSAAARCSLWWSAAPAYDGHRPGLIGHYAACNGEAAAHLLTLACSELSRRGCTLAVGPMDGSTHRRYRLLTERGTEPPFFLEPDNPDDWPGHFTDNGFVPMAHYYSTLVPDLSLRETRLPALAARLQDEGIRVRALNPDHFHDELRRIYRVAAAGFRHNFLYGPIDEAQFLEQYLPLRPYVHPELVLLAESKVSEVPAGFLFAIPDALRTTNCGRADTIVIKTIAVHPRHRGSGLGTLLGLRCQERARGLGYTRAIHALMHEGNLSRRMSAHANARPMRRYTLYARTLEGRS